MAIGAALVSTAGSLLGGLFGKKSNNSAQNKAIKASRVDWERDRKAYLVDRKDERHYANWRTENDRRYASHVTASDRAYQERRTAEQRAYDERMMWQQRDLDIADRRDARQYAAGRLADDRAYMDRKRDQDIARHDADRDFMQARSNELVEKTAASRGIDFVKLRDDAIKAGYNPMTAMSMAHAYSTERNYALQGGVYSPGANYTASGPGYNAVTQSGGGGSGGGGGVMAPASTVASSTPAAPASFSSAGGGYQSNYDPSNSISSGKFISDAFNLAADTFFNKPEPKDELAEALHKAMNTKVVAETAQLNNPTRNFGYDMTSVKPFKPDQTVGVPALASKQADGRPPRAPYDDVPMIPILRANGSKGFLRKDIADRMDVKPWTALTVGDESELKGELAEVNAITSFDRIEDHVFGAGPWGNPKPRDYGNSGSTGTRIIPSYRGSGASGTSLGAIRGRMYGY